MLNKEIFVRDIEFFFFSVYRTAHRTILKNFGPTQCINSLRIAKRHYMTLKLYIHPYNRCYDKRIYSLYLCQAKHLVMGLRFFGLVTELKKDYCLSRQI